MSPKPFRSDSYRKPYGVRERSDSGYGYGKGNRGTTTAPPRAREDRSPPSDVTPTQPAERAWEAVLDHLPLCRSTLEMWIDPCSLIGEHDGCLVIAGPPYCTEWIRRRYAKGIADAIREHTDYRGLTVADQ